MADLREVDDATMIKACEDFFSGAGVRDVKDLVNAELAARDAGFEINRNEVYQLIRMAKRRKFFVVVPPRERVIENRIADRYRVPSTSVHVANSDALNHVAASAADVMIVLIRQIQAKKKKGERVRIGLGGGWTSMLVVKELAIRLRGLVDPPDLALHALSSGFDVTRPQTAPVSFFGLFENLGLSIEYFGLFATAVAEVEDYEKIKESPGVRESFAHKDNLDLVITSLGSASHAKGDFSKFMLHGTRSGIRTLQREQWQGDIQYRPFSPTGPILVDAGIRAVTLLELEDLRKMASDKRPDQHVVVVAGPCSICGHPRSDAVLPLLESPDLKLWTHLVMDRQTASHLIPKEGEGDVMPPPPPRRSKCAVPVA